MVGTLVPAEPLEAPEYVLKARVIARFPNFVKWPAPNKPITVGVLGEDPFGEALGELVKVRRSKNAADLKGCDIVFISKSERGNLAASLAALAGTNAMTVSDIDGFARQGGILGFVMVGDKLRFEINIGAAKRARIRINSDLLNLAIKVITE